MNRNEQQLRVIRANALMFTRGDVLADFEAELIAEVHKGLVQSRFTRVVTPAEMAVIDDAMAAMQAAPRQDLTDKGMAA